MLNTVFKPSNKNSNVKQLMSHILRNMKFDKYQQFLQRAARYPEQDHKFVVFEYVQSPADAVISHSERLPGTRTSIHSLIQRSDFDQNMVRLFGECAWYTRRKIDYTKSPEDELSNTRQLVLLIKRETEDDYSDMPSLNSNPNAVLPRPVLNPETDDMPPLLPMNNMPPLTMIPPYNFIGSGLNQTMWTPLPYTYNY